MPGIYCSVGECLNNKNKNPDLSFHRFPSKDEQLRHEWIVRCKPKCRKEKFTGGYVCSDHFKPEMFKDDMRARIMNLPSRRELVPGALPELKLPWARNECSAETSRSKRLKTREKREEHNAIIRTVLDDLSKEITKKIRKPVEEPQSEVIIHKNVLFDERRVKPPRRNHFELYTDYKRLYEELLRKYEQRNHEYEELRRKNEELQKRIKEAERRLAT